jgi:hypothetical protein
MREASVGFTMKLVQRYFIARGYQSEESLDPKITERAAGGGRMYQAGHAVSRTRIS